MANQRTDTKGATVKVTLKPGTYTFFCRVHPFMRGSFRVTQ